MRAKLLIAATSTLLLAPLAADAQSFRCTGKDGKKYYGQTVPPQCTGMVLEQLNSQGMVIRRIDPEGDERAREAKEAEQAKKREEDAANREESRRNRALLATYTSVKDIDSARRRALADNQKAVKEAELRIEALKKRRAAYDKELEFYKEGAKPPSKLAEDIRATEIDIEATQGLLESKQKEAVNINAKYDEDKRRYQELTGRK